MILAKSLWHAGNDGDIWLFTLYGNKIALQVSNLGCTMVSIHVQSKQINRNIILNYKTAEEYLKDEYYVGSLVGRHTGRISGASFNIDGNKYLLSNNIEAGHHLHGGFTGFNKKTFTVLESSANDEKAFVKFQYLSPDGEEGYPGNLNTTVTISLNKSDEIHIVYEAETDKNTIVNLTHHCYYNLSGKGQDQVMIHSNQYVEHGEGFIPTGKINTLSQEITTSGFNEYFVFSDHDFQKPKAEIKDPASGLSMILKTTYPGVLYYTGDYLDSPFHKNEGYCLETQLYPDAPNHPEFPSTILRPGEKYHHETIMGFNYHPGAERSEEPGISKYL